MCKTSIGKKLEQIKNSTNSVKEFRQEFDKCFAKITKERADTKVLDKVFYDFIEQEYKPTTIYNFLMNHLSEINSKILDRLDDEGKQLFEIYEFLQDEFCNDFGLQSFIYGYSLANALNTESANYKSINEIMENLNKILEDVKTKE